MIFVDFRLIVRCPAPYSRAVFRRRRRRRPPKASRTGRAMRTRLHRHDTSYYPATTCAVIALVQRRIMRIMFNGVESAVASVSASIV